MSRPGDAGLTVTRYETREDATKRIVTKPMDSRVLELAALAMRASGCTREDPCGRDNGFYHAAGECYWLVKMDGLAEQMAMDGVDVPFTES